MHEQSSNYWGFISWIAIGIAIGLLVLRHVVFLRKVCVFLGAQRAKIALFVVYSMPHDSTAIRPTSLFASFGCGWRSSELVVLSSRLSSGTLNTVRNQAVPPFHEGKRQKTIISHVCPNAQVTENQRCRVGKISIINLSCLLSAYSIETRNFRWQPRKRHYGDSHIRETSFESDMTFVINSTPLVKMMTDAIEMKKNTIRDHLI
jgi:hypothetical protein